MQSRPTVDIICIMDDTTRIVPVGSGFILDKNTTHNILTLCLIFRDILQQGIVFLWCIAVTATSLGVKQTDRT